MLLRSNLIGACHDYPGENYVRVVSEFNRRNLSEAVTIVCFGVGREPAYKNIEF